MPCSDGHGEQQKRHFYVAETVTLRQKRQAEGKGEGSNCKTVAKNGGVSKLQLEFRLGHNPFNSTLCAINWCQVYIIASRFMTLQSGSLSHILTKQWQERGANRRGEHVSRKDHEDHKHQRVNVQRR